MYYLGHINLTTSSRWQTWGGGTDSYFEYLIKYGRITNNADPIWVEAWKAAVDSSVKYLATTSSVGNHLYLTDYTKGRKRYIGSHLECFAGGNWIMGGRLLNNDTIVNYGLKLVDACINTYQSEVWVTAEICLCAAEYSQVYCSQNGDWPGSIRICGQ